MDTGNFSLQTMVDGVKKEILTSFIESVFSILRRNGYIHADIIKAIALQIADEREEWEEAANKILAAAEEIRKR